MDPATETAVAHLKLAWWQEEMQRLKSGSPVHPISSYLAALPRAAAVDFTPLLAAVEAAAVQVGGAPLERGADLLPHADALCGGPLTLASRLAAETQDEAGLRACTRSLAAADYLSKAIRGYRREARAGRIPFPVDELLAAGVENSDLTADAAPPHLQSYLDRLRSTAAGYFEAAALALAPGQRGRQRHLLVLAALGRSHLVRQTPPPESLRLKDLLIAWTTARRAHG